MKRPTKNFASKIFGYVTILLIMHSSIAYSESNYSKGYARYTDGNFVDAEKFFKLSASEAAGPTEKARSLKMLGIVYYMQGARGEAEQSFFEAKKLNPDSHISPSEVLDQSVISFFNSINVSDNNDGRKSHSKKEPAAESQSQSPKQTYLQVKCNVEARVWVNGKTSGKCGDINAIPAGNQDIKITAPGYLDRLVRVNIKEGLLNLLQINLQELPSNQTKQTTSTPPISKGPADKPRNEKNEIQKTEKKPERVQSSGITVTDQAKVPISFMHFMPFGAGQFANGNVSGGAGFLLGEVVTLGASLYYSLEWSKAVDNFNKENPAKIKEAQDREDTEEGTGVGPYNSWRTSTLKKINDLDNMQLYFALATGVIYALGVTEAIVDRPNLSRTADRNWHLGPALHMGSAGPILGLHFSKALD